MKHFFVVGNSCKKDHLHWMDEITKYILAHKGSCENSHLDCFADFKTEGFIEQIPKETQCIIVLGGDGTLIRCASCVMGMNIPLIGMNLGTMGYLCDMDETNFFPSLDQLLNDDFFVEQRMMLTGHSMKSNQPEIQAYALNDIVIYRYGDLRVIDYCLYVNGELLNTYTADGMIIATPTGSTGYSMSCGGPIVDPAATMIVITPISPHTWGTRSIVLNSMDEIVIEVGERHPGVSEMIRVSYDGDFSQELQVGDKIRIEKSKINTQLVKLKKMSFVDNIRKKMQGQK
jgi:NAD+ kinase